MNYREDRVGTQQQIVTEVTHFLYKGNKQLSLSLYYDANEAFTCIENIPNEKKIPGATTALYKEAQSIMQGEANRMQEGISYTLSTKSEQMKTWAQTKGNEIFNWDSIFYYYDFLVAMKDIVPENDTLTGTNHSF